MLLRGENLEPSEQQRRTIMLKVSIRTLLRNRTTFL